MAQRAQRAALNELLADRDLQVQIELEDTLSQQRGLPHRRSGSRYDVGDLLGSEATGDVHVARDCESGRVVAMKVLRASDLSNDSMVARFAEEVQLQSQLDHPGICAVHDVGVTDDGLPYYTMRRATGLSLQDILNRLVAGNPEAVARYTLQHLVEIFHQICDAIAYAHRQGVLHCGLSPSAIHVNSFGDVEIGRWELAELTGRQRTPIRREAEPQDEEEEAPSGGSPTSMARWVVQTGLGKSAARPDGIDVLHPAPAFAAPEQVSGERATVTTDVYALGAILYNIVYLRPPVAGQNDREVLAAIEAGNIAQPAAGVAMRHASDMPVPDELAATMAKALNLLPDSRCLSVAELRHAVILPTPTNAPVPVSFASDLGGLAKSSPGKLFVFAAALVAIGLAVGAMSLAGNDGKNSESKERIAALNVELAATTSSRNKALAELSQAKNMLREGPDADGIADAQKEAKAAREWADTARREAQASRENADLATEQAEAYAREIDTLRKEAVKLRQEMELTRRSNNNTSVDSGLQAKLADSLESIAQLKDRAEKAELESTTTAADLMAAREQLKAVTTKLTGAQTKLQSAVAVSDSGASSKALRDQLQKLSKVNQELLSQIDQQRQELVEVEQAKTAVAAASTALKSTTAELAGAAEEAEKWKLEARNAQRAKELATREITALREKTGEIMRRLEARDQEVVRAQIALAQKEKAYQAELEAIRTSKTATGQTLDASQAELASFRDRLQTAQQELAKQTDARDKALARESALHRALEATKQDQDRIAATLAGTTEEAAKWKLEAGNAQRGKELVARELTALREKNAEITRRLETQDQEVVQAINALDQKEKAYQAELEAIRTRKAATDQTLEASQAELASFRDRLQTARQELAEQTEARDKALARESALHRALESAKRDQDRTETTLQELQAALDKTEASSTKLAADLAAAKTRATTADDQVARLATVNGDLAHQLEEAKVRAEEAMALAKPATEEAGLAMKQAQVARQAAETARAEADIARAEADLARKAADVAREKQEEAEVAIANSEAAQRQAADNVAKARATAAAAAGRADVAEEVAAKAKDAARTAKRGQAATAAERDDLRAELNNLQTTLSALSNQFQTMNEDAKRLKASEAELRKNLDGSQQRALTAETQLAELTETAEQSKQDLAEALTAADNTAAQAKDLHQQLANLTGEFELLKKARLKAMEESGASLAEANEARAQMEEMRKSLTEAQATLALAQDAQRQSEEARDAALLARHAAEKSDDDAKVAAQQALEEANRQQVAADKATADAEDHKARSEAMAQQLAAAKERVAALEQAADEALLLAQRNKQETAQSSATLAAAQVKLDKTTAELASLREERSKLLDTVQLLNGQLETARQTATTADADRTDSRRQLAEAKAQLQDIAARADTLREAATSSVAESQAKIVVLEGKLATLTEESAALRANVAEARTRDEAAQTAMRSLETQSKQLTLLKERLETTMVALEASKATLAEQETAQAGSTAQITALRKQLAAQQASIENYELATDERVKMALADVAGRQQALDDAKRQTDELTVLLRATRNELGEAQRKFLEHQEAASRFRRQIAVLEKTTQDETAARAELSELLNTATENTEALTIQLRALDGDKKGYAAKIDQAERERQAAEQARTAALLQANEAVAQRKAAEEEARRTRDSYEHAQASWVESQSMAENLRNQLGELRREQALASSSNALAVWQATAEQLKIELKKANADLARLRSEQQSTRATTPTLAGTRLPTRVVPVAAPKLSDAQLKAKLLSAEKLLQSQNSGLQLESPIFNVSEGKVEVRLSNKPNLVDISALNGLPITHLYLQGSGIRDLNGVSRMPLRVLNLYQCRRIGNFAPLRSKRLIELDATDTTLNDLRVLAGMPLTRLFLDGTSVQDLLPLRGMPLTYLSLNKTRITDLTPLRSMRLRTLSATDTNVSDISILSGMPLQSLGLSRTLISDISPLRGLELHVIYLNGTNVDDISALTGMPVTNLNLSGTPILDLAPLSGLPMRKLNLEACPNTLDLQPLVACQQLSRLQLPRTYKNLELFRGHRALRYVTTAEGSKRLSDVLK